jgi:putative membrane protein
MGWLASLLAGGFGLYLIHAFATGALYFYIHPIYMVPVAVAGTVLVGLAAFAAPRAPVAMNGSTPSARALALLALPLLIGVALPARPLGLAAATQRGVDATPLGSTDGVPELRVDVRPETLTIKDWVQAQRADPEPERHAGKSVRVTGFVYRDHRLPDDWFLVARFVVQCCAVDAQPIGLPVRLAGVPRLEAGTWVIVSGVWEVAALGGERRAVIAPTAVTPTERPEQPYLY